MISLIRVDDRLVHGLVAVSWTNEIQPNILLVANDEAANDSMLQMTMKLGKPAGVTMAVKTIDNAIGILQNTKYINKKIFVVTKNVKDAYKISEAVKEVPGVNVGTAGINYKGMETVAVLPQVKMTRDEFNYAKKIDEMNIPIFAQVSPTEEKKDFIGIKKAFNE